MAKRGLGKGLGALIPEAAKREGIKIERILVDDIKPSPKQPRKNFDEESMKELASSIKEIGLIQPIIIRPKANKFELVVGERRLRAAREAGMKSIPAIIKDSTDIEVLETALVENLMREDLNPLEEAHAFRELIEEFKITHENLADRLKKSRTYITNTLRLLALPVKIQKYLIEKKLSAGHGRALLSLQNQRDQEELAQLIIERELSVREAERLAERIKRGEKEKKKIVLPQLKMIENFAAELEKILGVRVRIRMGKRSGHLEISFNSLDELDKIYKIIQEGKKSETES